MPYVSDAPSATYTPGRAGVSVGSREVGELCDAAGLAAPHPDRRVITGRMKERTRRTENLYRSIARACIPHAGMQEGPRKLSGAPLSYSL
jgi:hypothetical protein